MKAQKLSVRRKQRARCYEALDQTGVNYRLSNGGAHVIINTTNGIINFWPRSEKWHYKGNYNMKKGLESLIEEISATRQPAKIVEHIRDY